MTTPPTAQEFLLLYWDQTGEDFTVTLKVTTDPNVSANALIRITTNGVSHDEPVGAIALRDWKHKLAKNEKLLGAITLVYDGSGTASARIIGECLKPSGKRHQKLYDSTYSRTGQDAQAVGVGAQ